MDDLLTFSGYRTVLRGCPSPPFEIGAPPFHVWPTGYCIHPILYFKNVAPLLVFSPPLLLNSGDGSGRGIVVFMFLGVGTYIAV